MTQTEHVLEYMHRNGSITPLEALNELGCFRLASRISDLKASGVPVMGELVTENGKRFKRYWVKEMPPVATNN